MEPVSWLGVLVAVIVVTALGFIWYSPAVFGTIWMRLSGHTEKSMKAAKNRGMTLVYVVNLIATAVLVFVLAQVLISLGVATIGAALSVAFWLWLGFFATVGLHMVLWDGKPLQLYFINVGYHLVSLMLASIVLVSF